MKHSEYARMLAEMLAEREAGRWLSYAVPVVPRDQADMFVNIINNIDPQWEHDAGTRRERGLFYCLVAAILEDMGQ